MDNKYFQLLKSMLESKEGRSDTVYQDEAGNPTVGVGTNLNSPEGLRDLEKAGMAPERALAGESVPAEVQDAAMNSAIRRKEALLQEKLPNAQLKENERAAVMSLMYNSPALVGPRLTEMLNKGDKEAAAKEILLNSNKNKSPGLASRRMEESAMFRGNDSLPPINMEEEANLKGTLSGIENKNEKERVFRRLSELLRSK